MVRFRRDRWYNLEGQQTLHRRAKSESKMFGRLVSLVVLLILVTLLMQRVSDPRVFENAFRQLGVPLSSPEKQVARDANGPSVATPGGDSETKAVKPTSVIGDDSWRSWSRDIWSYLLRSATQEVRNDLAGHLFFPEVAGAEFSQGTRDWIASIDSTLDRWQDLITMEVAQQGGVPHVEPVEDWWPKIVAEWGLIKRSLAESRAPWGDLPESTRLGFEDALDLALLRQMRDAAFWGKAERLGVLRAFQRSESAESDRSTWEQSIPVSIASLMNAPDRLRGRWVRIVGSIARDASRETLRDSSWGGKALSEKEYRLFWLRPADGTEQPLCLYLSQDRLEQLSKLAEERLAQSARSTGKEPVEITNQLKEHRDAKSDPPLLELECLFVKRLAYRSQRGVDVAPLFVVRNVQPKDRSVPSVDPVGLDTLASPWRPPSPRLAAIPLLINAIQEPLQQIDVQSLWKELEETSVKGDSKADRQSIHKVLRVLHQSRRVPDALTEMAQRGSAVGEYRCRRVHGVVIDCMPVRISTEDAEWFGAPYFYQLKIQPIESTSKVDLAKDSSESSDRSTHMALVPSVPKSWLDQPILRQPIALDAIDLNSSAKSVEPNEQKELSSLLLCGAIDWSWKGMAELSDASPLLAPHLQWLGARGWNLVDTEVVSGFQKQPLQSRETEPLLSLIRIADEVKIDSSWPLKPIGIDKIFENPRQNALSWSSLSMRTVRVRRVPVVEDASRGWLDGDFYFEVDGFARLNGFKVRLQTQPDDQQPLVFEDEFPMTVVCRSLPDWLRPTSIDRSGVQEKGREGDDLIASGVGDVGDSEVWYPREAVQVQGFFYRFWSYASQLPEDVVAEGKGQKPGDLGRQYRQVGPILVGAQLSRGSTLDTTAVRRQLDRISGFFALGLVVVVYVTWRVTRYRRKMGKR